MPTPITLPSGALVEGPLDPTLPLVVLLHGLGGPATDMTAPMAGRPGIWFDHSGGPPLYVDRGFAPYPPLLPASDFFMDAPRTSLTSWRQALLAAGFSTVTYTQVGPLIANDVAQLTTIATEINANPELSGLRVAMVAHSRGGL